MERIDRTGKALLRLLVGLAGTALLACGGGQTQQGDRAPDAGGGTPNASGGSAGSGVTAQGGAPNPGGGSGGSGVTTQGGAANPGGGARNSGGSSVEASGGTVPATNPYDGLSAKPDADTTPVASCTGQPDMKLCSVATTPDRDYDICVGGVCVSPGCGDTSCNAPGPHFLIPPNSHHAYLQLQPGAEPVVIDLVTGLHWQACTAGDTGENCDVGARLDLSWDDALKYCNDSTWAGKTDWYLPDPWEMLSILDWAQNGAQGAGLDPAFFPDGGRFPWTSARNDATRAIAPQMVYGGSFALTTLVKETVTEKHAVRCARRGFSGDAGYTSQRFETSELPSGKLIEDKSTGLIWQGCSSGATGPTCTDGARIKVAIADFVSYCEALSWGGFDDWRLPTYTELHSIVQYAPLSERSSDPSIPGKVFDLGALVGYLAARTGLDASAKMILISTRGGEVVGPTGQYPVTCVRWK